MQSNFGVMWNIKKDSKVSAAAAAIAAAAAAAATAVQ